MAKYSRFDPRNKKKTKDKYRSEKKRNIKSADSEKTNSNNLMREIEKRYNY